MATIALGIAGNAVLPGVGGMLGAMLGSYVDQSFLFPAIFGKPETPNPALQDIDLSSANEGSPVPMIFGDMGRLGCRIIWWGNKTHYTTTEDAGGKGGGKKHIRTDMYKCDVAVLVSEVPPGYTAFADIFKIRGNTEVIYYKPTGDAVVNNLEAEVSTYPNVSRFIRSAGSWITDGFIAGDIVTSSGFSISSNNGVWTVYSSTDTNLYVYDLLDLIQNEAASTGQQIKKEPILDTRYDAITFYMGDQTTPDPTIEAIEGSGTVPSWTGYCYFVIEGLVLYDFGNSLPSFTAEPVLEDNGSSVGDVITSIYQRTNRPSSEVVVSDCPANMIRAYILQGASPTIQQLETLMLAYNIGAREEAGTLSFFDRTNADSLALTAGDLAIAEAGSVADDPVKRREVGFFALPRMVVLQFQNIEHPDRGEGEVKERTQLKKSEGSQTLNWNLGLTQSEARQVAGRILWTAWGERVPVSLSLPPSKLIIQEGDILTAPYGDLGFLVVRVETAVRGSNGRIEIEGVTQDAGVFDQSNLDFDQGTVPQGGGGDPYVPPPLILEVLDLPCLSDLEAQEAGYYWAVCAMHPWSSWLGAALFRSVNESSWDTDDSTNVEAVMGITVDQLGDGPVGYWDNKNTVTVDMYNGALSSYTEEEVTQNYRGLYLIGDEILFAKTATYIGEVGGLSQYTLSGLLRGKRNTEGATGGHAASGERVLLLDRSGVRFITRNLGIRGTNHYFRGVSTYSSVDDVASVTMTPACRTMMEFSPGPLKGYFTSANALELWWSRRSRGVAKIFGAGKAPNYGPTERYELDMFAGAVYKATKSVTAANVFTYTQAARQADGFTIYGAVTVKIYQISELLGRGNMHEETFSIT